MCLAPLPSDKHVDLLLMEKLYYFSAAPAILHALYCTLVRTANLYPRLSKPDGISHPTISLRIQDILPMAYLHPWASNRDRGRTRSLGPFGPLLLGFEHPPYKVIATGLSASFRMFPMSSYMLA